MLDSLVGYVVIVVVVIGIVVVVIDGVVGKVR